MEHKHSENEKENVDPVVVDNTTEEQIIETENKLELEIAVLKDQLLRAVAETENVRKRGEKQLEDVSKYSVSSFAKDLISAMENLYRVTDNINQESLVDNPSLKAIYEGVELTKREFTAVFERNGIKRIMPRIGDAFDHNLHQAVLHVEASDAHEPGSVVQILQAGYTIHERLLTPAMVGVVRG